MLAVIPFIWGVQVWRHLHTLRTAGVALGASLQALYRQLRLTHSQDSGGSTWSLLMGLAAVQLAWASLWILQGQRRLAPAPRAPVGSVLCFGALMGKEALMMVLTLSSCTAP